jgi:hypothetical protein
VGNRQDLSETLIGRKLSIRQFTEKLLLYPDFSTWNVFTGSYRDANHYSFSGLSGLYGLTLANVPHKHSNVGAGANITGSGVYGTSDLQIPSLSNDYVFIDFGATITNAVEVGFDGHDTPGWAARILVFEGNINTLAADMHLDPTTKAGKITIFNADGLQNKRLLLQITNTTYHRPHTDKYSYDYTIRHNPTVNLHEISDVAGDIVIYKGIFNLAGDFKIHKDNTLYLCNGSTVNLNDFFITGQSQEQSVGYPIEGKIVGAENITINPLIFLRSGEKNAASAIVGLYPSLYRVGIVDGKPGIHDRMSVTLGEGNYSANIRFSDESLFGKGAGKTMLIIGQPPSPLLAARVFSSKVDYCTVGINIENDFGMLWSDFTVRDYTTGKPDNTFSLRFGSNASNSRECIFVSVNSSCHS